MIYTEVNGTLADLLEVYRVKVTGLEEDVDRMQSDNDFMRHEMKRLEDERDRHREDAERNRKLIKERAERNVKLQGVIDSLRIELQNEREAHQATKENQA